MLPQKLFTSPCSSLSWTNPTKKWPEKLRRYALTKGNQEKTDRIRDIIDIIDIINLIDIIKRDKNREKERKRERKREKREREKKEREREKRPRTFGREVWHAIHWANGILISLYENLAMGCLQKKSVNLGTLAPKGGRGQKKISFFP